MISDRLSYIEQRPELYVAVRRQHLVEQGLLLLDTDQCPLCDKAWDIDALRLHLEAKKQLSIEASQIYQEIQEAANNITASIASLVTPLREIARVAKELEQPNAFGFLQIWGNRLIQLKKLLMTSEGIAAAKQELLSDWQKPIDLDILLGDLKQAIDSIPERSDTDKAIAFLTIADERLSVYVSSKREFEFLEATSKLAKQVYEAYCGASEFVLGSLYAEVEKQFNTMYQMVNSDDERSFTSKLTPEAGKLDLTVDFYQRTLAPPGAYHSEGHQDTMGLCLYLALMRQVYGDELTLVVLDDVVMSVDSGHRFEICRMIKSQFPNTQFIITTHEEAWFHQMQSADLIKRENARVFQGWTIEDGPLLSNAFDAWSKIDEHLNRNDVSAASHALRRHLEVTLPHIAHFLGARPSFRMDGRYEARAMFDACHASIDKALGEALQAAKGWRNEEAIKSAEERRELLAARMQTVQSFDKYINATIHFNEWAALVKQDFVPVVDAYREYLKSFYCDNCHSILEKTRANNGKALICSCGLVNLRLNKPSADQKTKLS